eukprot:5017616-Pleurochrysis_carterae.AAC.1
MSATLTGPLSASAREPFVSNTIRPRERKAMRKVKPLRATGRKRRSTGSSYNAARRTESKRANYAQTCPAFAPVSADPEARAVRSSAAWRPDPDQRGKRGGYDGLTTAKAERSHALHSRLLVNKSRSDP